jgi:hypothetical protein
MWVTVWLGVSSTVTAVSDRERGKTVDSADGRLSGAAATRNTHTGRNIHAGCNTNVNSTGTAPESIVTCVVGGVVDVGVATAAVVAAMAAAAVGGMVIGGEVLTLLTNGR